MKISPAVMADATLARDRFDAAYVTFYPALNGMASDLKATMDLGTAQVNEGVAALGRIPASAVDSKSASLFEMARMSSTDAAASVARLSREPSAPADPNWTAALSWDMARLNIASGSLTQAFGLPVKEPAPLPQPKPNPEPIPVTPPKS